MVRSSTGVRASSLGAQITVRSAFDRIKLNTKLKHLLKLQSEEASEIELKVTIEQSSFISFFVFKKKLCLKQEVPSGEHFLIQILFSGKACVTCCMCVI